MKQRRRIYYSAAQRSEIWDRWQTGEAMKSIGRRFDRASSSVFSVISRTGGTRPAERRRASKALSLAEREEISRGLSMRCSLRLIARRLYQTPAEKFAECVAAKVEPTALSGHPPGLPRRPPECQGHDD